MLSGIVAFHNKDGVHWNEGINRLELTCRFWRSGKARQIILMNDSDVETGMWLRKEAELRGVPESAILVLGPLRNTMDEANALRDLTRKREVSSFALVTSGFHMRRDMYAFRLCGLDPFPCPADSMNGPSNNISPQDFFPSAGSMRKTEIIWREVLGIFFYFFRFGLTPSSFSMK